MKNTVLTDPAAVYCPYYISETPTCIICEGLGKCMDCVQRFQKVEEKNGWVREVCSSSVFGRLCAVASTLTMLYDEDAPVPARVLRHFSEEEKRIRCRKRKNRRKMQRSRPRPAVPRQGEERA